MKNIILLARYIAERAKSATWAVTAKFSLIYQSVEATEVCVPRAKTMPLIVDNYIIHKSRETQRWLKENPKFRVIYQQVYSPWVNHFERLWQALHETITRNHQCRRCGSC